MRASRTRPCGIVVAVKTEIGEALVYVLPIAHTPPRVAQDAVELPQSAKVRLGLDSERSWIVLTEANIFAWRGPDLRFIQGQGPESIAYGMLPPKLMAVVKDRFITRLRTRRAATVKRTESRRGRRAELARRRARGRGAGRASPSDLEGGALRCG